MDAFLLEDADPNSFEQVNEYFWKDKNYVFLLGYGINETKINGADPQTFKVIENYQWSMDKNNVYFMFDKLNEVNTKTFIAIDQDWGKDNKNYYHHNLRVDSLDYSSARIISPDYISDRNRVYFRNLIVKDANPKTFKADGAGFFGHDDKFMFDYEKNEGPITEQYRKTYIDK